MLFELHSGQIGISVAGSNIFPQSRHLNKFFENLTEPPAISSSLPSMMKDAILFRALSTNLLKVDLDISIILDAWR